MVWKSSTKKVLEVVMATANQLLTIARKQIGVSEAPPDSNNVRYWRGFLANYKLSVLSLDIPIGGDAAQPLSRHSLVAENSTHLFTGVFCIPFISQPYIKNDITAVYWRSIASGEMVRRIIGSGYR